MSDDAKLIQNLEELRRLTSAEQVELFRLGIEELASVTDLEVAELVLKEARTLSLALDSEQAVDDALMRKPSDGELAVVAMRRYTAALLQTVGERLKAIASC